eukprot:TRINITY_DN6371_c0_g2_i1.p1 TRINITY_DN6371_c0_g2~~TRINITY_DN6371_c0_g2_i1.p1  ORF type:complete len:565 (+),score=118.85 TRINITY_DN6371_c0_g2_i1:138-1697(+)
MNPEVTSAEIDVLYAEVYDAAPPLPRPLKTKIAVEAITKEGLLEEAMAIAPLNPEEHATLKALESEEVRSLANDGSITRHVKRNKIFQRKAREFMLVHQELADYYSGWIGCVSTIQTSCSFALTIVLYVPLKEIKDLVDNCVAVATLVLGVLKMWLTIARYGELQEKHAAAARGFGQIDEKVTSFLAALADVQSDDMEAAFGDRFADDAERADDASKAQAAAATLTKVAKLKPGECLNNLKAKALEAASKTAGKVTGAAKQESPDHKEVAPAENTSEVVKRLRLMYRKASEYRVAHTVYESFYLRAHTAMSFLHLVLSSSVSSVLFLKDIIGPLAQPISMALSTLLSGLNTAIGTLGLVQKAEKHTSARLAFASNQRSFATTLMIDKPDEIASRFSEYAAQWNETLANTFPLTPSQLHALRDEDDSSKPLLPLITPPIIDTKALQAKLDAKMMKIQEAAEAQLTEVVEDFGETVVREFGDKLEQKVADELDQAVAGKLDQAVTDKIDQAVAGKLRPGSC